MTDPYKVLNIPPSASDEEVKHAYRELARKYHPDNYHDNPLADLAQEKMKEINEAYDEIQKQRKAASGRPNYNGSQQTTYQQWTSPNPRLQMVRNAIQRGDILQAERLLNDISDHNAEWNFLMGYICYRRGWMDEARQYFDTAVRMDPDNLEYQSAKMRFGGQGYKPEGYGNPTTSNCGGGSCLQSCLTMTCCGYLLGNGGCYCLPCFI